jgi:hypothetical protein
MAGRGDDSEGDRPEVAISLGVLGYCPVVDEESCLAGYVELDGFQEGEEEGGVRGSE